MSTDLTQQNQTEAPLQDDVTTIAENPDSPEAALAENGTETGESLTEQPAAEATETADKAETPSDVAVPEQPALDSPPSEEAQETEDDSRAEADPEFATASEAEKSDDEDSSGVDGNAQETEDVSGLKDASASTEVAEEPVKYGYTGDLAGEKVITLAELLASGDHQEEAQLESKQLAELIEGTLKAVSEQEIVEGRVVSVSDKDVVIDIGFKSDGVVSKNEFSEDLEPGSRVEVFLERIEDYHGQLVLSKTKADKFRRWERVETAFENETVLDGTVIRRIKGGMIVELLDGLEAFLPGSQIDVRPVRDFDAYLEKRMEFKIVKINPTNENVVVSHKALIEKELEVQRASILATMEAGQILEGIVKNITDFGVFIDLGGVDGLLHITDLSWGRVSHPSEVIDLDQHLKVVVLDYDRDRQRISLGLKQLQPHPWENIQERLKEGDIVEGKVVSITDYGAFVELEKGIEGLVHISEMSWTDHIRHPSQKVSLGQLVNVVILNIDNEGKKISLGMKQFEKNPWQGLVERYPPGTVLRGTVRNITTFGAFVEIEPGIDGLVHISDLSWTKKIRHPGELVRKRQELDVVILDVDEKRQRVSLGHKQIETNPWADLAVVYEEGSDHKAKIVRVDSKGLAVELALEVEAFVPVGELKQGPRNVHNHYQEGEELELRVIRFDGNRKEVVMSEVARDRQKEQREKEAEKREKQETRKREQKSVREYSRRAKAASGPTTLGELSGLENLKAKMEAVEDAAAVKADVAGSPAESTEEVAKVTDEAVDEAPEEVKAADDSTEAAKVTDEAVDEAPEEVKAADDSTEAAKVTDEIVDEAPEEVKAADDSTEAAEVSAELVRDAPEESTEADSM